MKQTKVNDVVIGCGTLLETIEKLARGDDVISVSFRDQRRNRNFMLVVEPLLRPHEATWLAPTEDRWLRLSIKDLDAAEE